MISEKIPWKWTKKATEAVKALKEICKDLPKLYLAKDSDLLILNTDASMDTWGAILQVIPNAYEEFKEFVKENKPSDIKTFMSKYLSKGRKQKDTTSGEGSLVLSKWASGTFKQAELNYSVHEKKKLFFYKRFRKI